MSNCRSLIFNDIFKDYTCTKNITKISPLELSYQTYN